VTGPGDETGRDGETSPTDHTPIEAAAPQPPTRPGASIFTIEGRAAPGLFVVGWLASILGIAIIAIGIMARSVALLFAGATLLSIGLVAGAGNQAIERRARGAAYAGPSPFLVFGAVIAIANVIGFVIDLLLSALFRGGLAGLSGPVGQLVQAALLTLVYIGVVRLVVVGTDALSWADMGIRRPSAVTLGDLAAGASLAIPVIAVTLLVASALVGLFGVQTESPLPPTGTNAGLIVQLIAGALIAPLGEEILFRGFSLTAWSRSIGPSRAIIRASLLFALAHVITIDAGSFGEAIGLIAVGAGTRLPVAFVLGWLFVRRGSIWAPFALHATFNAILIVIADLAVRAPPV
jgi:membrane protease YdiL (CAAX protease family)